MSTQQLPQFEPCNCAAGACTGACKPERGGGGPGLVAAAGADDFSADDMEAVGRALMQAIQVHAPKGWHPADCPSEIVGDLAAELQRTRTLAEAAQAWSEERIPRDEGDAVLLKAVWTHDGDYTGPCDGCDGDCDEPCATSMTVAQAHAGIDEMLTGVQKQYADAERRRDESLRRMSEKIETMSNLLKGLGWTLVKGEWKAPAANQQLTSGGTSA